MADLSELQVGDSVAYYGGCMLAVQETTIQHVTTMQIVIKDGTRFDRRTGRSKGDRNRWHRARITPLNEQNRRAIVEARRFYRQRQIGERILHGTARFSFDQLERIDAIMKESLPVPEKKDQPSTTAS